MAGARSPQPATCVKTSLIVAKFPPQAEHSETTANSRSDPQNPAEHGPLLDSQELYRALVQRADDAMVVLPGTTVVECNAAAFRLFGGNQRDILGKKPWEITPTTSLDGGPSPERSCEYVGAAYAGNSVWFDWTHHKPAGAILYLDVTMTRNDVSATTRVVGVLRDVMAEKVARLQLEQRVEFQTLLATASERFCCRSIYRLQRCSVVR